MPIPPETIGDAIGVCALLVMVALILIYAPLPWWRSLIGWSIMGMFMVVLLLLVAVFVGGAWRYGAGIPAAVLAVGVAAVQARTIITGGFTWDR